VGSHECGHKAWKRRTICLAGRPAATAGLSCTAKLAHAGRCPHSCWNTPCSKQRKQLDLRKLPATPGFPFREVEAWHRHCDIEKCFPVLTGDSCGSRCSCSDGRGGGAGAAPKSSPIRSAIGSEAGAGAGAAGCGCGGGAAALAGGSAKGSIRPDQETHKVSSRREQPSHCEMLLRIQKQLDGRALLRTS